MAKVLLIITFKIYKYIFNKADLEISQKDKCGKEEQLRHYIYSMSLNTITYKVIYIYIYIYTFFSSFICLFTKIYIYKTCYLNYRSSLEIM